MLLYFSLSLFVSAALLFLVQPMIGKMILPQLGGSPAVWNTCMVFFQAVLLVGYGYTHLLTTTQSTKRQVLIQGCLLFSPFLFLMLPFSLGNWMPETEGNPVFGLLGKLTLMVGLPFLMVSTTAPLLQKWFFHTGHPAAKDPYFLYGASNLGSMIGLAMYPIVIEPWLPVSPVEGEATWETQVHLWTLGYVAFVGLVIGCAVIVWKSLSRQPQETPVEAPAPTPTPAPAPVQATAIMHVTKRRGKQRLAASVATPPSASALTPPIQIEAVRKPDDNITLLRRLRWIGLAAAPSSLMLGVTTYMTTDIAAIPAFWIIPLALYLLTFIFVFARWPWVWTGTPHTVVMFLQPCLILFLVLRMVANITPTGPWANLIEMGLNLGAFFSTTLMCHGELAKDRPSTNHLTEFYFWMSFGGVLGGLFNTLFAPVVFQYGLWEYLIAMAFACLVRSNLVDEAGPLIPRDSTATRSTKLGYGLDYGVPIAIGIAAYFFIYVGETHTGSTFLFQRKYLIAALVVLVLALSLRPVRFGLSIAALFIAMIAYERRHEDFIYEGRGFFGRLRVYETIGGDHAWEQMPAMFKEQQTPYEWKVYRRLMHGGINHGMQIVQYKDDRTVFPVLGAGTVGLIAGPLSGGPYCAAALFFPDREEMVFQSLELTLRKRREPITYFYQRNGVAELYYKMCWPDAQPVAEVANMNGAADARMTASMVGLGACEFSTLAMLGNTQSEPPYAVIGLGTGILACYAKPYQHVDFFEIDPLVKNLSVVPGYIPKWRPDYDAANKVPDPTFYFIQDAQDRGAKIDVKLGDGRLKIKDAPQGYYHTIMLDAFSSDAIPVHLLTKDAVKLYLDKLAEGGVLIFNTTNRYVEINGVLAAIARDLDLDCLRCSDVVYTTDHPDRYSADWLVLQRKIDGNKYKNGGRPIHERLEASRPRLWWNGQPILKDGKAITEERWKEVKPFPGPAWTDGYSNLLNPRVMPWLMPWRETRE